MTEGHRFRIIPGLAAAAVAVLLLVPPVSPLAGQDGTTRLVVRAVANDAKVVGSGVGGARVTVTDAATAEVLAEGVQRGGTGDTRAIMRAPRERGASVYGGEGTAAFTADLALEGPTRVRVTAEGPLDAPEASRQTTSTTLWMVPGRDVAGEGLVLTLHGFVVEFLGIEPGGSDGGQLEVSARVRMMCGCPTEPGGLWDSDRYEMTARLVVDGRVAASAPLRFAGQTSTYRATLPRPEENGAAVELLVTDTERVNGAFARREIAPR